MYQDHLLWRSHILYQATLYIVPGSHLFVRSTYICTRVRCMLYQINLFVPGSHIFVPGLIVCCTRATLYVVPDQSILPGYIYLYQGSVYVYQITSICAVTYICTRLHIFVPGSHILYQAKLYVVPGSIYFYQAFVYVQDHKYYQGYL